jgi:glutathione S-transferase
MEARLYVIPGSHPSMAARLMLEAKGIPYKRTDLMPVISKGVLRVLGFPRNTVPAIKIEGRRIQGTGEIARELDRIRSEPPLLLPADPAQRSAVEEAERFGDQELQPAVRAILWWGLRKDKAPLRSYSEGAKLGIPIGLALRTAGPIVAASARFNEATDDNVRRSLAALPAMLQKIDDWIAAGVIGDEQPNVADFQIAPSLRLAMTLDDLRPAIEGRPAGALAKRLVPNYPGVTPPVLPPAWLQPLRSETAAA